MTSPLRSTAGDADAGVFGIPVNGFHPQLTAVSNPVRPNDIAPPSWPSYVPPPPSHSRRAEERRNRRRGGSPSASSSSSSSSSSLLSLSSPHDTSTTRIPTAPMTSDIDARTTIVVRRLQDDAKESDRSRSKMLRKRVRREERSERRHLKRRLRQHHTCGGRRTSETSETSFSSTTSSLTATSTGTGTYTDTDISSSATATSYAGSSDASACCSGSSATHPRVTSSSSTVQERCPPAAASTPAESGDHAKIGTSTPGCAPQPVPMHADAAADRVIEEETHFSELYTDVFMASNKPQFLSTLGGRLVAWNDEFLAETGFAKAQLSGCLTVHNLVDSKYHAVLNDLFELALRGDTDATKGHLTPNGCDANNKAIQAAAGTASAVAAVVVASRETTALSSDDARERQIAAAMAPPSSICLDRSISPTSDLSDDRDGLLPGTSIIQQQVSSSAQYTSLMLPCALFPRRGLAPRKVTIVLMNDVDPSRRCFYCVMSPMESNRLLSTRGADGRLFPSLLVDQPKGIVTSSDCGNGSPLLPVSQLNVLGMVRYIGDAELTDLLYHGSDARSYTSS